jgi:hypothetical protein
VVAGDVGALLAFAIAALLGWPGLGVILVPMGLGMIIFGGMQVVLYR